MQVRFKTNLKCQGCIDKITPYMQAAVGVLKWTVDIHSPEKWLVVEGESVDIPGIVRLLSVAGFTAEPEHV